MALAALSAILAVLTIGAIGFYAAGGWQVWRFFRRRPPARGHSPAPPAGPVSVMVPVCGFDDTTGAFLEALCRQDYPDYEVLVGTTDPEDPAGPWLLRLAAAHPGRVRLFLGLPPHGPNRKDSILRDLVEAARHDVLVFADSDLRIDEGYLAAAVAPLADPAVGLVTFPYAGRRPKGLGQALGSLGRCLDFIPGVLLARRLDGGLRFALGITLATRRQALAAAGGLLLDRIGSDYNLGKRFAAAGYRVELPPLVLDWVAESDSIADLVRRELRWARSIRFNRGPQYYSMVFCHGTLWCLLLLLASGGAGWALGLAAATCGVRTLQALACVIALGCPRLLPWLWAVPLRDLLSALVWLGGGFGRRVRWRGRLLRIRGDGLISEDGAPPLRVAAVPGPAPVPVALPVRAGGPAARSPEPSRRAG
ncbi:MAG: glycosyltransferase [Dongiaceae bacterium]